MPYITTEVEVYFDGDDFSDDEIAAEVNSRLKRKSGKAEKEFLKLIGEAFHEKANRESGSLLEEVKLEVVYEGLHTKTLDEIEEFFKS